MEPQEFDLQTDVVFVSHLVNESHAGHAMRIFILVNLPSDLVAQGDSVSDRVLVLIESYRSVKLLNISQTNGLTVSLVPRVILTGFTSNIE